MERADSHDFVKIRPQRHPLFAPASDNVGFDRDEGHVFDIDGLWLTTVELPPRFRLHEIGPDWILGVTRDDTDVEVVTLLRLEKPA